MTKIEELEQRLEVMEQVAKAYGIFKEEVEQLQKALAELKESKKEGKWKPKQNEQYWFRDRTGDMEFFHYDTDHEGDRWRIDNLPVFPTKEQCEKYWHFMDTVKEKSYSFSKEEWEDSTIKKYYIEYTYSLKNFDVTIAYNCRDFNNIYFKTGKSAQYIIDNFKDELIEYWI